MLTPRRWLARGQGHVRNHALNPVLVRDIRAFFRGARPMWLQLAYLALVGVAMLVAALICEAQRAAYSYLGHGDTNTVLFGQYMFVGIFETQAVLLALIVIGHAAGAISFEFEKRTYDMLAVTSLTSVELVAGKVISITLLGGLLLLTSLPLSFVCLLVGGISPGQIILCYGLSLAALPLWAASCLLISTLSRRTITSYVACMLWMVALLIGCLFLSSPDVSVPGVGMMNPMVAFMTDEYAAFRILGASFPAWLGPLVLDGLFMLLFMVLTAESLPLRAPSRSGPVRVLVAGSTFVLSFLVYSALVVPWGHPGGPTPLADDLLLALAIGLQAAWTAAVAAVCIVCTYRPPREAYAASSAGASVGFLCVAGWHATRWWDGGWRSSCSS